MELQMQMTVLDVGSPRIVLVSQEDAVVNRELGETKVNDPGYYYDFPGEEFIGPYADEPSVLSAAFAAVQDKKDGQAIIDGLSPIE